MSLNGVIVISGAINYQTIMFQPGNDLPYGLFLPSYAATAWHHKKVAPIHRARPLADFLAEVEAFAAGEYQSVLFKGTAMKPAEREAAAAKIAEYTGLSAGLIEEVNLRISAGVFFRELLRADGRFVGRFDGRYTSNANPNAQPFIGFDPSVAELQSAYRTALELVLKEEIGIKSDVALPTYETGSGQALVLWDFGAKNRFFDSSNDLQRAMIFNPQLRLFVAEGYFDLATPYRSVDYTIEHFADARGRLKDRISVKRYEAGHMMYAVASIRKALARDIGAFIASSRQVD
jgi:carboxypeptidase C (cathepsin A)